ncbi:hypothetical protein SKAU_G00224110 [Synaphobranchus kaupii]|uniref:Cytosolic fatty-acid binding proteins domain-containing protein n=1 Tax=Synaphobranchus kaupii TaxID=118154 RepID=A0A9Q1IVS7_SYNKA|nr:hypothetical protein SKAU_G00224110 [Synaphobranchus kaupii]
MDRKIPNFAGTWKMKSSENFDELLKALGVNMVLRRIAGAAASKPSVEITPGRGGHVHSHLHLYPDHPQLSCWETQNKISCEQVLQKGEGPKTAWTREITNDGELILTMSANDVVCTRVYLRE